MRMWTKLAVLALVAMIVLRAPAAQTKAPNVGSTVQDFILIDAAKGEPVALSDFKDKKAVALIFVSTQCPVSNAYDERIEALNKAFSKKGVQFVGINSNSKEAVSEVVKHAKEHKFTFPVLKDTDNQIADVFGAKVTPEVYLLEIRKRPSEGKGEEAQFLLRYHGWIDDSRDPAKVKEKTLETALTALLTGKPVPKKTTKAFGSTIKRVEKGKADDAVP